MLFLENEPQAHAYSHQTSSNARFAAFLLHAWNENWDEKFSDENVMLLLGESGLNIASCLLFNA